MQNSTLMQCQSCNSMFTIEPEDFAFYEKIKVPPPTWCPECRLQRRLIFRNERFLYKRVSDYSGKEIFSMYPPEAKVKVYENDVWFSDKWDPLTFGRDVDFTRPFLDQLHELFQSIPLYALSTMRGVNSDYSNNFVGYKNCYLMFNGDYCEDCMYGSTVSNTKTSLDITATSKCENCYDSFWLKSCATTFFSSQCAYSYNLVFCKNCTGCHDCIGSVNLRNKSYHIFNKPYPKEDYQRIVQEMKLESYVAIMALKEKVHAFWLEHPVKYLDGLKNLNVSGQYIFNSKNTHNAYLVHEAENTRYCSYIEIGPLKDCYDYTVWGSGAELLYEVLNSGLGVFNVRFSDECWPEVRDTEYSLYCQSSSNLFGCVGVRQKKWCIFNKEYPEEQFFALRKKLIDHMNNMPYKDSLGQEYRYGDFFPAIMSPFPYNHTPAHEHFPLKKEDVERIGGLWKENEDRRYTITKKSSDLPDTIAETQDSITSDIILCKDWEENPESAKLFNCTKAFRILPQELAFYRRFDLPLPRKCPTSREVERIKQRNSVYLYRRTCSCTGGMGRSEKKAYHNVISHFHGSEHCPNEFETSYAPDRPEIVYCEKCYVAEAA